MNKTPRTIDAKVRRHIWWQNGFLPTMVVGVMWGLTGLAVVLKHFGYSLSRRGREIDPEIWVPVSAVLTVLGLLYVGRWVLCANRLAKRGMPVTGTIRAIGGVKDFEPLRRLEFSYTVADRAYRKKITGGSGEYAVGTPVELLVDPLKPTRCMFRDDVLPKSFELVTE